MLSATLGSPVSFCTSPPTACQRSVSWRALARVACRSAVILGLSSLAANWRAWRLARWASTLAALRLLRMGVARAMEALSWATAWRASRTNNCPSRVNFWVSRAVLSKVLVAETIWGTSLPRSASDSRRCMVSVTESKLAAVTPGIRLCWQTIRLRSQPASFGPGIAGPRGRPPLNNETAASPPNREEGATRATTGRGSRSLGSVMVNSATTSVSVTLRA